MCICILNHNKELVAHSPFESKDLECELRLLTSENARLLTELTDLKKLHDADTVRHEKEIEKYRMRYDRLREDHSKLNQLNQELESKIITVLYLENRAAAHFIRQLPSSFGFLL
ncbi:unnamed protein product, partial [Dibothriocephalus latus]